MCSRKETDTSFGRNYTGYRTSSGYVGMGEDKRIGDQMHDSYYSKRDDVGSRTWTGEHYKKTGSDSYSGYRASGSPSYSGYNVYTTSSSGDIVVDRVNKYDAYKSKEHKGYSPEDYDSARNRYLYDNYDRSHSKGYCAMHDKPGSDSYDAYNNYDRSHSKGYCAMHDKPGSDSYDRDYNYYNREKLEHSRIPGYDGRSSVERRMLQHEYAEARPRNELGQFM